MPEEVVGPVRTLTKVGFILSGIQIALMLPAVLGMILPGGRDLGFMGLIWLAFVAGAPFAVLAAAINAVSWFREEHRTAKIAAGTLVLVHLGACFMTALLAFSGNSRLLG